MYRKEDTNKGFTLIELMLAMAFVAILLLFIALTVIQMSNIYNKGLTMKAVNQAGLTISKDIRQTLSQGQAFILPSALCLQSANGGCVTDPQDAVAGRLCTGLYTYIWNYGKSLDKPINQYLPNSDPSDTSGTNQIRLVRVRDNSGQYCADPTTKVNESDATDLLSSDNDDLAVQSFAITQVASNPAIGQALYRVVIEISTSNQSALQQSRSSLDTIDTNCRPPSDDASLINYCAVNRFDFTAEAGSEGGQ